MIVAAFMIAWLAVGLIVTVWMAHACRVDSILAVLTEFDPVAEAEKILRDA